MGWATCRAIRRFLCPSRGPDRPIDNCSAPMGDHTLALFFVSFISRSFPFRVVGKKTFSSLFSLFSIVSTYFLVCSLFFQPFLLKPHKERNKDHKKKTSSCGPTHQQREVHHSGVQTPKTNVNIGTLWRDALLRTCLISIATLLLYQIRPQKTLGH